MPDDIMSFITSNRDVGNDKVLYVVKDTETGKQKGLFAVPKSFDAQFLDAFKSQKESLCSQYGCKDLYAVKMELIVS